MTRVGLQLIGAIRASVHAEISSAFGARDDILLRQLHDRSCQAALWLSGALVAIFLVLGRKMLHVWTHGTVEMDPAVFGLLLAVVLPAGLWMSSLNVVYATNRHQRVAVAYILTNLALVLCAYELAKPFQLRGVAAAVLLADLFMTLYVVRTSLNLLNERALAFVRAIFTVPAFVVGDRSRSAVNL
jgi:O-antigen/teichoic acid export membrane protein